MTEAVQRVVVIQDASKDISLSAIKWTIDGLSLKPGDELTLLGVQRFNKPSAFHFTGAGKIMGYKTQVDSRSTLETNQEVISQVAKKEEYQNSIDILQLEKLFEVKKIAFSKKVVAAYSPKAVALETATNLKATWIILDRQLKKDKKYFMDGLSCGIASMKSNNNVKLLREPKTTQKNTEHAEASEASNVKFSPGLDTKPARLGMILWMLSCGIRSMKSNNSIELLKGAKNIPENIEQVVESKGSSAKYNENSPSLDTKSAILDTILGMPDDDLFSLEIFTMKSRSSLKNSSNDKLSSDNRKGLSTASSVTSSSPKYLLSKKQPQLDKYSIDVQKNSKPPSFRISETMCVPLQLQEAEFVNIPRVAANDDPDIPIPYNYQIQRIEISETSNRDELKDTNKTQAILAYEITNRQPACLHCGNERPNFEVKRDFTYAELHAATNGFSSENFLSEGGFGSVYRGKLKDGQGIAVKQYKHESLQGEKEFMSEVHVLSKAIHKNVVMLLGSCSEGSNWLLVYEYICNGSLDIHLSKDRQYVLSWKYRMNIALGVARGLNYLHQNNIIHRDMRPDNILITHDYEPLLGDFGLARTQHNESEEMSERKVVGTIGYLAPEYAERGRVSTKTDIYSFGVVLLELMTGKTTWEKTLKETSLVGWARPLLKEKKYPEIIDERILDCHDVYQLFWMVRVAELCLQKDPDKRPSMEQVERVLECITDGETVTQIEEFSPARSSDGSSSKSNESQGEEETYIPRSKSASSFSTTLVSSFPSLSSMQSSSTTLSTSASSPSKRKSARKRREKSQSQLLYDEMLN